VRWSKSYCASITAADRTLMLLKFYIVQQIIILDSTFKWKTVSSCALNYKNSGIKSDPVVFWTLMKLLRLFLFCSECVFTAPRCYVCRTFWSSLTRKSGAASARNRIFIFWLHAICIIRHRLDASFAFSVAVGMWVRQRARSPGVQ
jgi:hypothetical protein